MAADEKVIVREIENREIRELKKEIENLKQKLEVQKWSILSLTGANDSLAEVLRQEDRGLKLQVKTLMAANKQLVNERQELRDLLKQKKQFKKGTTLEEFIREVEEEARQEGPEAVKELEEFREKFRLAGVLEKQKENFYLVVVDGVAYQVIRKG